MLCFCNLIGITQKIQHYNYNSGFQHCLCLCRANPVWLDPFCRNLELAAQADHEDDLPENLSEITDLWNSPARTHVSLASFVFHNSVM